ncbi:MAG: hypothetical protein LLG04_16950 [Parachlamydia sp.]|nr:hypothetical protein [Parachlamydia sp.]
MTRSGGLKLLIVAVILFGIWKIGPWQPSEQYQKLQADKAAYAEYVGYVNDLRSNFAREMRKELDLVCSGDSGRMHGKVEEIGLDFTAYRRANIEEARALQLYVMNKLVQAVNAHEKLASFLDERPFTYKRVNVSISFQGPNGRYCDGSVVYIYNISDLAVEESRNKFFYSSIDPFTGDIVRILKEPYEEAVKLAAAAPIHDLRVHQSTPIEEAIDEVLPKYTEEMLTKCRFECSSIGGKMTDRVEDIGAEFVIVQHVNQEEARKFILFAAERLLHALNGNKKLREYLSEFPFPSHRLKIRIGFRKRNYYTYCDGSMESVTLEGNEITYYQEPPPEQNWYAGPDVFAKESYQDALKKGEKESV